MYWVVRGQHTWEHNQGAHCTDDGRLLHEQQGHCLKDIANELFLSLTSFPLSYIIYNAAKVGSLFYKAALTNTHHTTPSRIVLRQGDRGLRG